MHDAEPSTILKTDALGRVTLTREKRAELLEAFDRSGLKGTQFARLAGVNYGTFASWVQDRRHARGEYPLVRKPATAATPPPLRLLEATLAAPASASSRVSPLEVHLPGGAKLLITDSSHIALVAQLLNSLRVPC
jgi:transposase-like protein